MGCSCLSLRGESPLFFFVGGIAPFLYILEISDVSLNVNVARLHVNKEKSQ